MGQRHTKTRREPTRCSESIAGNVRTACHSGVHDEVCLISKVTVDVVSGGRMRTPALHPF